MKKLARCLGLTLAFCLGSEGRPAFAVIGTIDEVPAATLLLPYFEVDITNPTGTNTIFSINNAFDQAVLTKVTTWSDQSVPVLNFNVYLTGYDVQTIDLRQLFVVGNLPITASAGQDPGDTISPQGPLSQDINFASCSMLPPTALRASHRAHLQAWLQGLPTSAPGYNNQCAGFDHNPTPGRQGDGILRGYITIDTVNACNIFFPGEWPSYAPFVTDQNVLWGDYAIYNNSQGIAHGETLVHIESCPTCFVPGDHTFYGRYNGANADDSREPLPTTTAARYLNSGGFSTDFLVWREANAARTSYGCNNQGPPSWFPLESKKILIFDEEERVVAVNPCQLGDPFCEQTVLIPNEANRIDIADLSSPFNFGWIYLNLQHDNPGFVAIYGDNFAQSWTTALTTAGGLYSIGYDAIQLDNANTPNLRVLIP